MKPDVNSRPDFVLPTIKATDFSLSYSSCSLWDIDCCQEPAQEIPLMTRSCGRDLMSKADQDSRDPLDLLDHLPPKPESVLLTILCLSPTLLTLTGGYPRPPFSGKNQLRALVDKSLGHERNISIQTPYVGILACLAGLSRLLQLHL